MRFLMVAALTCVVFSAISARAHEFWLSPESYVVAPGEEVLVRLRIGQGFKGASYVYSPKGFVRFDFILGDQVQPVSGRLGDDPAMALVPQGQGLGIVVHETKDLRLSYSDWSKFVSFVEHKDFAGALERHAARGLPETGFRESYRRYAKSLIGIGNATGSDREVGLHTEFVALANPYTDDLSAGMPFLLLRDGAPRVDAQVEVFQRIGKGDVVIERYRTDAEGRVIVPVVPGAEYLVDAVILKELENQDPKGDPVWHSDWAALTFSVPLE